MNLGQPAKILLLSAAFLLPACANDEWEEAVNFCEGSRNKFACTNRTYSDIKSDQERYFAIKNSSNAVDNATKGDILDLGIYGAAANRYIRTFTNDGFSLQDKILPEMENSFITPPDLALDATTDAEIVRFAPGKQTEQDIALLRIAAKEFKAMLDPDYIRPANHTYAVENIIVFLANKIKEEHPLAPLSTAGPRAAQTNLEHPSPI